MRRELAHHAQEVRQAIRELVKQPELEPSARRTVRDLERAFHDALRDAFRSAREADGDRAAVLIEGVGGATDALAEGLRSALGVAPPAAAVPDVDPQTSRIDRVA